MGSTIGMGCCAGGDMKVGRRIQGKGDKGGKQIFFLFFDYLLRFYEKQ